MELKFVNNSYFKQFFQNLRPKLQYSKNRFFVTSHFGTLLNETCVFVKLENIKKVFLVPLERLESIFEGSGTLSRKVATHVIKHSKNEAE